MSKSNLNVVETTQNENAVENTAQDVSVNVTENVASVEPEERERFLSIKKEGLKNALKDIEMLVQDINCTTGKEIIGKAYYYAKPVKIDIVASDIIGGRYLVTDLILNECSYQDTHSNAGGLEGKVKKVYPCIHGKYCHLTDSPRVGDTILLREEPGTFYYNRALQINDMYGVLDIVLDEWERVYYKVFRKAENYKAILTDEEMREQLSQINEECLAIWSKHREQYWKFFYRK